MLVRIKPGDIMDQLLLQAVQGKNIRGEDSLFFRCEEHGFVNETDLKSNFTNRLDCVQCVALGMFYRRGIASEMGTDPLTSGEQVNEALLKACEDAAKGKFDFQPARDRKIAFEETEALEHAVVFSDFPQKRVF